jgi:hypothetical protein
MIDGVGGTVRPGGRDSIILGVFLGAIRPAALDFCYPAAQAQAASEQGLRFCSSCLQVGATAARGPVDFACRRLGRKGIEMPGSGQLQLLPLLFEGGGGQMRMKANEHQTDWHVWF